MRALLFAAVLLAPQAPATPSTDPQLLAGIWEGIHARSQAGDCGMSGPPVRLRLAIIPQADGSLVVQRAGTSSEYDWKGRIADGTVVFEAPRQSTCNGKTHVRTTTYSGAMPEIDGKRRLLLRGTDAICPEMGCRFADTLRLAWKAPLP